MSDKKCKAVWNFLQEKLSQKYFVEFIDNNCLEHLLYDRFENFDKFIIVVPTKDNATKLDKADMEEKGQLLKKHIFRAKPSSDDYSSFGKVNSVKMEDGKLMGTPPGQTETKLFDVKELEKEQEIGKTGIKITVYEDTSGDNYVKVDEKAKKKGGDNFYDNATSVGGSDCGSEFSGGDDTRDMQIQGGGKQNYFIRVGRVMSENFKDQRIMMMISILDQYKNSIQSRGPRPTTDIWLSHCVSMYNWLYTYSPDTLETILPITDVHPGVTLALTLLDPKSPVTDSMLARWNMTIAHGNAYQEWAEYLKNCCSNGDNSKAVTKVMNMVCKVGMNPQLPSSVIKFYETFPYANHYKQQTVNEFFSGTDGAYRKMWQDQVRCVISCALVDTCDLTIVEDVESTKRTFMDLRAHSGNYKDCVFLMDGFGSNDNLHYAFVRWVSSTDFMYLPTHLNSKHAYQIASYCHSQPNRFKPKTILNNYNVRTKLVQQMNTGDDSNFMNDYMKKKKSGQSYGSQTRSSNYNSVMSEEEKSLFKLDEYTP